MCVGMYMCMCVCVCAFPPSVNLSLYTRSACFILSHETLARGETQLWEVQMKKKNQKTFDKKKTLLLAVTPHTFSSVCWGAVRLLNLHHSKGQSMEEGPFVRNCQRRQGPQAWSPRVKSAYLGCHLDMTGPQGQGRRVKLLTTLNVTPALLYYERHAKWLTSSTATKVR